VPDRQIDLPTDTPLHEVLPGGRANARLAKMQYWWKCRRILIRGVEGTGPCELAMLPEDS